jgi:hypothetical protein
VRVIFVDIDETVCDTPGGTEQDAERDYHSSVPRKEAIDKINKLYDEGNKIVYWTARGSKSGINWYDLTYSQLNLWGAKFHQLRCDKPYYDLFYDDRTQVL